MMAAVKMNVGLQVAQGGRTQVEPRVPKRILDPFTALVLDGMGFAVVPIARTSDVMLLAEGGHQEIADWLQPMGRSEREDLLVVMRESGAICEWQHELAAWLRDDVEGRDRELPWIPLARILREMLGHPENVGVDAAGCLLVKEFRWGQHESWPEMDAQGYVVHRTDRRLGFYSLGMDLFHGMQELNVPGTELYEALQRATESMAKGTRQAFLGGYEKGLVKGEMLDTGMDENRLYAEIGELAGKLATLVRRKRDNG